MSVKVEELKKDLDELKKLSCQASRQRIKDMLSIEIRKIETDIISLSENISQSDKSKSSIINLKQRGPYTVELTNYAWDQSDKFLKLFVSLDGVQNIETDNVIVEFSEKSMKLMVKNLNDKNYSLIINNLLHEIDIQKSYKKIKSDMIAIYIKKLKEGIKWECVTSTEKRVKELKTSEMADIGDDTLDSKDPSAGLMNMMKKIYETGDDNMKRMIAKTWTESQEKRFNENIDF